MSTGWLDPSKNLSVLDRDHPRPLIVRGDRTADYAILGIMIFLILLFWLWIMYVLWKNSPVPTYYLTCTPGKCATNIYNGEKRCPADTSNSVVYDPEYEVCNSMYACESSETPYAVLIDGSTNDLGICDTNVICRCVQNPQCALNTLTYFSFQGGDLSNYSQTGQTSQFPRTRITQDGLPTQGYVGQNVSFTNSETQFCGIKLPHMDRVIPRTPQCNFSEPDNPQLWEAAACINSNPCPIGRLAFKPTDLAAFTFNYSTLADFPVSCVPNVHDGTGATGNPNVCMDPAEITEVGAGIAYVIVPVWNSETNMITCVQTTINANVYGFIFESLFQIEANFGLSTG